MWLSRHLICSLIKQAASCWSATCDHSTIRSYRCVLHRVILLKRPAQCNAKCNCSIALVYFIPPVVRTRAIYNNKMRVQKYEAVIRKKKEKKFLRDVIALYRYIITNIVRVSHLAPWERERERESLMNISHFHAARRRRSISILHRCRYAMLLQLAAVTFSHTCSPLHLPMIREAFAVPIRAFHHYVSSIALRDERRNMLVKLQSLGRYIGHENGTRPLSNGRNTESYSRDI